MLSTWAWSTAGPLQPSRPDEKAPLVAPTPRHACRSCWARKAPSLSGEHPCAPRQGETPRTPEAGRCCLQTPLPFLLPRPRMCRGPGEVTEPPCTLGCPPRPPSRRAVVATWQSTAGVAGAAASPTATGDAGSPGQAGREGVISDVVPSTGFQSQKGGIQLPFPPHTSSSHYLRRGECWMGSYGTGSPKPPCYIPASPSTPFPLQIPLLPLHPDDAVAPSPTEDRMGPWPGSAVRSHLLASAWLPHLGR